MRQIIQIIFGCIVFSSALAASFDCVKANTKIEKMICADAKLSKLDDELTNSYRQAIEKSEDKQAITKDQRHWLKETRNSCVDTNCLKAVYEVRIHELSTNLDCENIPVLDDTQSVFIDAIAKNDIATTEILIKHTQFLDFVSAEGWSPLTLASSNKNPMLVELLLKHGANPNLVDCRGAKYTALETAAFVDALDVAKVLVKYGANVNVHGQGTTPLHMAAFHGRIKFASFLIQNGAEPNLVTNSDGWPPLFNALSNDLNPDKVEMISLLLQHGANPNLVAPTGVTALHKAIGCFLATPPEEKRLPLVELLIKYGANPNTPTFGITPLICARSHNDSRIEAILITAGAHK